MTQQFGQTLVVISMLISAVTIFFAALGVRHNNDSLMTRSRYGLHAAAFINTAISLLFLYSILTHDFSNEYVASYSDSGMPLFYLLTAFWGGEKGVLLFWVVTLSILNSLVIEIHRNLEIRFKTAAIIILAGAVLFFGILMVFASNPFEAFITFEGPVDGNGLNPLLQNPLMALHPPTQLLGFIGFTVPYAFAMAALVTGKLDETWIKTSRSWTLIAWTFLTLGLVLGGLWAYLELGWGGFWAWDPVENAALLPWCTGTALIHSALIQERRSLFRRWNIALVVLTFLLTIFATFLTRSQLIESLHAFADSVLADYFLYYMAFILLLSLAFFIFRAKSLTSTERIESFFSRESFFVLNNVMFLFATIIILFGTLLPKISESSLFQSLFMLITSVSLDTSIAVDPDWFDKVVSPLGLFILFLTGVGPLIPFKKGTRDTFKKNLFPPLIAASLVFIPVMLTALFLKLRESAVVESLSFFTLISTFARKIHLFDIYALIAIFLSFFVAAVVVIDLYRGYRKRKEVGEVAPIRIVCRLLSQKRRHYFSYIMHLGVALSFIGFAGGAFKKEKKDIILSPGEGFPIGNYHLVFLGSEERFHRDSGYASITAKILVNDIFSGYLYIPTNSLKDYISGLGITDFKIDPQGDFPLIRVLLTKKGDREKLLLAGFAETVVKRNYTMMSADKETLSVYLRPYSIDAVQLIPRSFNKHYKEITSFINTLDWKDITANVKKGEFLFELKFADREKFDFFIERMKSAGAQTAPFIFIGTADSASAVYLIASGTGEILHPEMRFYMKHPNPTSEVDVRVSLFEDLYLAMAPAFGENSVSVTAMVNPLIMFLWMGTLIMSVSGIILVIPPKRQRGEAEE